MEELIPTRQALLFENGVRNMLGDQKIRYCTALGDELWVVLEQVAIAALDQARHDLAIECIQQLHQQFPKKQMRLIGFRKRRTCATHIAKGDRQSAIQKEDFTDSILFVNTFKPSQCLLFTQKMAEILLRLVTAIFFWIIQLVHYLIYYRCFQWKEEILQAAVIFDLLVLDLRGREHQGKKRNPVRQKGFSGLSNRPSDSYMSPTFSSQRRNIMQCGGIKKWFYYYLDLFGISGGNMILIDRNWIIFVKKILDLENRRTNGVF
ncbi:TPR_REGION domain-containing protein [Meloidogyne graminicola]|uniref:ER membrane protein complex subunit 2 n=1 Tax=Meloidogyne graminicola TaxID=189291 RepID=A0A8S9ZL37_9BILA|nr:TPR_REGION domain-containing protein [Meloidogyne graminicola]